ncbi:MAG: ATP-binding cassette domain-containing protein, partial [Anaerolineae bacterium]|nr:ATP-binding cassette domain-containing protein [Anaerolineae bacterium]
MAISSNMRSNRQSQQQEPPFATQPVPAVTLNEIRVRYSAAGPLVLDIDSLTINAGERIAIIGPSGAAKTTLLRLINGYVSYEA